MAEWPEWVGADEKKKKKETEKTRCRLTFSVNKFKELHQYWHSNKFNYKLGNTITLPKQYGNWFSSCSSFFAVFRLFIACLFTLNQNLICGLLFHDKFIVDPHAHVLSLCLCVHAMFCARKSIEQVIGSLLCFSRSLSSVGRCLYLNAWTGSKYSLLILSVCFIVAIEFLKNDCREVALDCGVMWLESIRKIWI